MIIYTPAYTCDTNRKKKETFLFPDNNLFNSKYDKVELSLYLAMKDINFN